MQVVSEGKALENAQWGEVARFLNVRSDRERAACNLIWMQTFNKFTYGREVICHCDHKPISAIMSKPLHAAPPRLQRMLLQLQTCDINVQHIRGKDIPISDRLSRHFLSSTRTLH